MKEALPVLDQEEEYKRIIEENEKQGLYRFRMKLIDINRITKVTRQGRIQRYSAMVLVGNGEVWRTWVCRWVYVGVYQRGVATANGVLYGIHKRAQTS